MAELTEQQLESAKQELAKVFGGPMDDVLMTNMLRAAAPYLQFPWDEPTDGELILFKDFKHVGNALIEFVRRRNTSLIPNSVDPIKELILKGIRNNRPWPLDLEAELKLADEIQAAISAPPPPGARIIFTGFKPLDSAESDHMYRTSVLERPAPPREEFKKNPADMPQPVDTRKAAIVKMFADVPGGYSAIGAGNREHVADMILAALDGAK